MCNSCSQVSVQLYSPLRPLVDVAEVFLWLMAVGTILCASYWSAWTARESAIEQEKLLKVAQFFPMPTLFTYKRKLRNNIRRKKAYKKVEAAKGIRGVSLLDMQRDW